MISKEDYLKDPCGSLSIPYFKATKVEVPANMKIINSKDLKCGNFRYNHHEYMEELYFRLIHRLNNVQEPDVPNGFCLVHLEAQEMHRHINTCYENIHISLSELQCIYNSEVFDRELLVALKSIDSNEIAATGIAVIDKQLKEGSIEWVQVSESYRRKGIGTFIVSYILNKMKSKADFVTVSGKVQNKNNPEKLYRKCGFQGDDVWHIIRRK